MQTAKQQCVTRGLIAAVFRDDWITVAYLAKLGAVVGKVRSMALSKIRPLRGNAPRVLVEPPLFVRLCQAFVDNLGIILKTGFVFGAILLVQDLLTGLEDTREAPPRSVQILEPDNLVPGDAGQSKRPGSIRSVPQPLSQTPAQTEPEHVETFMSDGVKHALNCTYREYRNKHYDSCVDEPSDAYPHPPADPDDRGYLEHGADVLLASAVRAEPSRDL